METDQTCQHFKDNTTYFIKNEMDGIGTHIKLELDEGVAPIFVDPLQNLTTDYIKKEVDEEIKYSDHLVCEPELYNLLVKEEPVDGDELSKNDEGIIKHGCKQCNFSSTKKSNLVLHVESVHEGIKYSCQQCDYKATRKTYLAQHVKNIHEGLQNFPCQHCDYSFTKKGYLSMHVSSVHGIIIKNFLCQQCDFSTSKKTYLTQHVKSVHEGLENFPCQHCEYRATQKGNLVQHMDSVHKNQNEISNPDKTKCKGCGKYFSKFLRHVNSKGFAKCNPKYSSDELNKYLEEAKEEAKEKMKARQKKYFQTEHGKASQKKYFQTENGKASQKKYFQTKHGKARRKEYEQTKHGKARQKKYNQTKEEKARQEKYPYYTQHSQTEEYELVLGLVCEPELDNLLVEEKPMEKMDESEENHAAMSFSSTVKEEPFISTVEEEPFISTVEEEPIENA